ncbi:adaptor protein MecA [Niameybacter massiliensis]|uniref:adaptor protein MecA n=1 Tax=Niameybacter massiliensis TaxID=1658108 RepID=UPI0006B438AC|nr:adaptor protein MecA [Niameybacter massiliensis]
MKIEKISDTQIRVTLNHSDLQNRDIKIGELAYGSTKAQALFRDMMAQAYEDFGFEAENVPLMIEAVPLSTDSIMIVVTKVEDPTQIEQKLEIIGERPTHRTFKDSIAKNLAELEMMASSSTSTTAPSTKQPLHPTKLAPAALMYAFRNLDDVSAVSHHINHLYFGETSLYKYQNRYYVILKENNNNNGNIEFVKSLLDEFGEPGNFSDLNEMFLKEHGKAIIESNALDILANYL